MAWSVVLVVLLIATVTQVVVSPVALGAPRPKDPRSMPLMVSDAKPKADVSNRQAVTPEADFSPLLPTGGTDGKSSFDPKTSKETGRTEDSIEFTNANGTKTLVLSQIPLGVPDGKGGWDPVDTRLVEKKDSKRVTAVRTGVGIELAEFANDPALFKVNQGGVPVTLELEGAGKAGRKVDGSTATYANALPNTDVKYEVSAEAIKESIILKNASAVGEGKWSFTLNTGALTPKVEGKIVKISDDTGKVVASLPPIAVWDSAGSEKDKKGSARTGGTYTLARDGTAWKLTVTVDKSWLKDSARKFPIVVDPTYTFGYNMQSEAIAYKQGALGCTPEDDCGIAVGNARNLLGQNGFWRTALRYNLTPLANKTVTGARLDLKLLAPIAEMKPASQLTLYQATSPLGFGALGPELASASIGENGSLSTAALSNVIGDRVKAADKNLWVMLAGTETNTYSFKQLLAALIIDYSEGGAPVQGPQVNPVGPVEDAIVATDTPTLEVSAATAGTLYCFKISTGFDGRSGSVVDSGCLNTPKWTVPRYVLRDGGRYTWTVATVSSGGATPTASNWVRHFTVDKRVGLPGPAPVDSAGPVAVNLFNGNAHTEAAGPLFEALGGSAGVTFAYNSRQGGDSHGVRASYFNDADHNGAADSVPILVRSEPQVNLDFGNAWSNVSENLPWKEDPMPEALDDQWFVVRWEGYFQVPVTGDFSFAGSHADGAKVWVDNNIVYDGPNAATVSTAFATASTKKSTDVTLTAGQRVPIKIELYHRSTSNPRMVLWAKSTTGTTQRTHNWTPRIVTTDWLYSQDPSPLPNGWTMGLMGSDYVEATMLDGSVVLTDTAGGKHTWAKSSNDGYTPPKESDGALGIDGGGRISVTENGVVSVFNVDGTLGAVSKVEDSKKPASLQYLYSGSPARLTQIKDPVSGRSHTLFYNTDNSNNCYGGAAFPTGAYSAPAQKLCRIRYWDGTETRLWYIVGALGRIENPGSEIRDYSYLGIESAKLAYDQAGNDSEKKQRAIDSVGELDEIRDPLAADWLATQTTALDGKTDRTILDYDAFYDDPQFLAPPQSRVITVTAPAPNGRALAPHQTHLYRYDVFGRQASVDIAGIDKFGVRTVTWDDAGRVLSETDAVGDTSRMEWNSKDKPTVIIDTTGRRTTLIYDHADRLIDRFGPAGPQCFNGQTPKPECLANMPHTHRAYDENLTGLESAFYDNPFLAGVPKEWATGVGTATGALHRTWGSTPPVANSGGWSGRFLGEIEFPDAGEYHLGFTLVDGARLWIDDVLIVDSWTDKPATTTAGASYVNDTSGSRHRIRVDYYNRSGTSGALEFKWKPPGTGTMVTVPGQHSAPRYGLETSKITYSASGGPVERAASITSAVGYSDAANGTDPVFGLKTTQIADPGGLNLTTRAVFEQPGQGFLRQLSATMPAGDPTNIDNRGTSTYYGDTETRANPCDQQSVAVSQGGRVKTVQASKNSQGVANTLETVYNAAGQIAAARTNNEPWSCLNYDSRGRTVKKSFPAMGTQPARTITYNYAVGGDPLKKATSDEGGTTTTVTDLLGRTTTYTDANGVTTATAYDLAGRITSQTSTIKGVTSSLNFHWDIASRLTGLDLDGASVAVPEYNAGLMRGVAYGNGTSLAITRNDVNSIQALAWQVPGSTVTSGVTRSRDQRIIDESISDTANPGSDYSFAYTYDSVGRLVKAAVPHHQMTYGYASDNGCGPNPKAGQNTNRTSLADSFNGAAPAVTNYCYDNADRLLSTNGATDLALTYDQYGNAITIGTDTLGYDSTRRHVATNTASGYAIGYTRDVTDRITARSVQVNQNPAQVTRYGFLSDSGGPDFVLDNNANLRQRILKLPGGALLTKTYAPTGSSNWSYPNIHGDIMFTADGVGTRTGTIHLYDPFGQNIDPVTGVFADIPIPATAEGGMDFGYLGKHTVPIEHLASQQALEMGARTYLPILGRFLQTDPVPGGSANSYDYANADPVNNRDLTGENSNPMGSLEPGQGGPSGSPGWDGFVGDMYPGAFNTPRGGTNSGGAGGTANGGQGPSAKGGPGTSAPGALGSNSKPEVPAPGKAATPQTQQNIHTGYSNGRTLQQISGDLFGRGKAVNPSSLIGQRSAEELRRIATREDAVRIRDIYANAAANNKGGRDASRDENGLTVPESRAILAQEVIDAWDGTLGR
ncbi:PA14 domain-containing protein [Nocardia sp. NBC_01377]|uniref:PA14 domain-containing protein n=1 Tax=Nocardia sp. NBC_01377 TaxID=2903595 RepID=UPI003863C9F9